MRRSSADILSNKTPTRAADLVDDMISLLHAAPLFQMLLVDYPRAPEELEIISRHTSALPRG